MKKSEDHASMICKHSHQMSCLNFLPSRQKYMPICILVEMIHSMHIFACFFRDGWKNHQEFPIAIARKCMHILKVEYYFPYLAVIMFPFLFSFIYSLVLFINEIWEFIYPLHGISQKEIQKIRVRVKYVAHFN